jgi:hypothetical protein
MYTTELKFSNESDLKTLTQILNKLKTTNSLTPLEIGQLSEAVKTMAEIECKKNEKH